MCEYGSRRNREGQARKPPEKAVFRELWADSVSEIELNDLFRQRQGGGSTGDSNQKMGIGDRWSRECPMERP
jgi:hypothetical protein